MLYRRASTAGSPFSLQRRFLPLVITLPPTPTFSLQRRQFSSNMEDAMVIGLATKLPILHPGEGGGEDEPALGLKTAIFWLGAIAAVIAALSQVGIYCIV